MNLKKAKTLLCTMIYLLIGLLILYILSGIRVLVYALAAVALIYIILYMKLWRCPHCGAVLGRSGGTHCPGCKKDVGIKLRIP